MNNLPAWSKAAKVKFEMYVDEKGIFDSEFKEHIDHLRTLGSDIDNAGYPINVYPSTLTKFMQHFGFQYGMKDFLRRYILDDVIDYSLVRSSVSIIDEVDKTYRLAIDETDKEDYWEYYRDTNELKIVIPRHASLTELREFIDENKDFLNERLRVASKRKRISPRYNNRRDARLRELWRKGKSHSQIASILSDEFNGVFGDSDIATMAHRLGLKREK